MLKVLFRNELLESLELSTIGNWLIVVVVVVVVVAVVVSAATQTYKSKSFLESLNALNVAPSDVRTKAIHVDDAVRSCRFDTNISSFLTSAG